MYRLWRESLSESDFRQGLLIFRLSVRLGLV